MPSEAIGSKKPIRSAPAMQAILRRQVEQLYARSKEVREKAARLSNEAESVKLETAEIEREIGRALAMVDEIR